MSAGTDRRIEEERNTVCVVRRDSIKRSRGSLGRKERMPRHCGTFDVDRWLSINFTVDDFFFSPLNDRDAQEETPIWIRQHSEPVTRNGPSFISWAWVCSRPIINYLISTLFNQRSGGMSGQGASRDFTAIDFSRSRRADEVLASVAR